MRISDFVGNICFDYEPKNKTRENNKRHCDSLSDTQNNSGVSIVINIDLTNGCHSDNDDEYTRKLYDKFYRGSSF